jgi:hypothetical protein
MRRLILAAVVFTLSVAQADADDSCQPQTAACEAPSPADAGAPETSLAAGPAEAIWNRPDAWKSFPPTLSPITSWRAPGTAPLADADAASRVRAQAENRPANFDENQYRPTAAELAAFRTGRVDRYGRTMLDFNPLTAHVTGGFSGTTDEILQWAAHKWGIPEDVVRAAAVTESNWNMSQLGDRRTVGDPSIYPSFSRVAGTSEVYESLGILQVKWNPDTHWGTEPLRWRSTAFNVDYWAATVRYYYDGRCDWCSPGYSAGQDWASVGAWFNPSPWNSSTGYLDALRGQLANRRWAQGGF